MRPNSLDLRQRIVDAIEAGHPKDAVSAMFAVDRSTINRYLRLAAAGDLAPRTSPGRPRRIGPEQEVELARQLRLHPTDTLAQHCQRWEATTGQLLSVATMSRAIGRLDWTRKKAVRPPGNATKQPVRSGGARP
jgi:putative transposase